MTVHERPVVVGYDGSPDDIDVVLHAVQVAAKRGAALHVVHTAEGRDTLAHLRMRSGAPRDVQHAITAAGDAEAVLADALEAVENRGVKVVGHTDFGFEPAVLRRLAKRLNAGVVVVRSARVPLDLRLAAGWGVVIAPQAGARHGRFKGAVRTAPVPETR